jgi:2-C-methyl-D-erythritol 2,4-cyclodiphosphate synthase
MTYHSPPPFRLGHGYDLHRLHPLSTPSPTSQPVRPLVLAGVLIPADVGPIAHSDGDAVLHAITDALLGAIAQPDLGQLFPDHAPENAARDSRDFLAEALRRAAAAGYTIVNLDATIILERPKIAPHKRAMVESLARLVALPIDRVNVKGKTHEGLDALGRGEAVEVHAVVLLAR